MSDPKLVVGPAWVGDMVMAQALFLRLRELEPDCVIDVLAPDWSLPLLSRMPQVRKGIELAVRHGEFGLKARMRMGRSLRDAQYARAIVLTNSWKSALVPYFARVPQRTGYAREFRHGLINDLRRLDKKMMKTTAERFVALAEDRAPVGRPNVPAPCLQTDIVHGRQLLSTLDLPTGVTVALMPGAEYGPAKRWPASCFARLAFELGKRGVRTWVFGSKAEHAIGELIVSKSEGAAINLCGRTGLTDVIDLLGLCEVAVTNDSGLMHVAAAVGVSVVAIYGSSTPAHTPPLTERKYVHYLQLDCSPCFQRVCPLGHTNCLNQIPVGAVLNSVRQFIGL